MLVNLCLKRLQKKIWLTVFASFIVVCAFSFNEVKIKGEIAATGFNHFRVVKFDDFITKKYRTLETVYLDIDGTFSFKLYITEIAEVDLLIQGTPLRITLLPGAEYDIDIKKDRFFYISELVEKSDVEVNKIIDKIDKNFDDFIASNYVALLSGSFKLPTHTFVDSVNSSLSLYEVKNKSCGKCDANQYIQNHIKSRVVSLELLARIKSESTALKEIEKWNLPWQNYEFVLLFENIFRKRFPLIALSKSNDSWIKAVNKAQTDTLLALMSKNEFYRNKQLREVGLVMGLMESFDEKEFNKRSILEILSDVSRRKDFFAAQAADNAYKRLSLETSGSQAPDFLVYDVNNKEYYLHDMKGRFVYLYFWDYRSDESVRELLAIEELQRNYGKHIAILPIVVDSNIEKLRNYLQKINFKGSVYISKDGAVSQNYNIKRVPYYVLINPDGKLVKNPALGPLEGIDLMFYEIKNRMQQRR